MFKRNIIMDIIIWLKKNTTAIDNYLRLKMILTVVQLVVMSTDMIGTLMLGMIFIVVDISKLS
jgi:hypothetical protein